ncbi:hypothetical protein ACIRD3_36985 [Kitasatospora sp. NPDC093550]|uniref:hypothetical protein n=1 Tax=Kitasatospora sp. NPDC093550 TaxID=3364089 RepID=UPI00380D4559
MADPGAPRRVERQPKVYEPTDTQIAVTIPDRCHEGAARPMRRSRPLPAAAGAWESKSTSAAGPGVSA